MVYDKVKDKVYADTTPLLNKLNHQNPDSLHIHWMKVNGYNVQRAIATGELVTELRGNWKGSQRRCKHCGESGHYAKTCPRANRRFEDVVPKNTEE